MTKFDEIKESISPELSRLNEIISSSLNSNSDLLNEIVATYLKTKGKQIRPIIVILSAKFFSNINEETLHAAASIELLHNASLIHDDVVDETKKRRGNPTINSVWDNHIAVLVGDFFVSNALSCAIAAGDMRVISTVSKLGKELSTGELDQIDIAKHHSITEDNYYHIIGKKTASLFRSCVQVGGYTAKAPQQDIDNLARFVELLGLCFQIKDDIFDYFSDAEVGKPTGNDLREGKVTLPLIYALSKKESPLHEEMKSIVMQDVLTNAEIERLIEFAKNEGGIEYAYSSMERLKDEACKLISHYPDSDAKKAFINLFDFIIKRHN
ncbi:MAG: polyprenyl synthetase family protein [Bacteroidetes bacterium]|uniref:Polyprenyl synthetase family protein n=1 Tax=Candidatus Limisoma faecipullorum TaxID=2840854 RepID=A0A9D9IN02_9BACT|nr:polyprenyl synthetase family protein [Candidatus Limisoma faecipullorum]